MKDLVLADRINETLADRYGRNYREEALFRVVWSDDQTESRLGTFEDFYHGVVYLRTVTEVREVLKYSYLPARWILERWIPGEFLKDTHNEVPSTYNGSYEPLYVFQDAQGNALPLYEEATHALVQSLLEIVSPIERRSLDKTEKERVDAKIREEDLLTMEEASPYLAGKIRGGETNLPVSPRK